MKITFNPLTGQFDIEGDGGGGGGSPAGSDGQIQLNAAGAFGADANLFWDQLSKRLGIGTNSPQARVHAVQQVGPTLLTNGDFNGNDSGWTVGAGWSYNANKESHTPGDTASLTQDFTIEQATTYQITFTVSGMTQGTLEVYDTVAASAVFYLDEFISVDGTYTVNFVVGESGTDTIYFDPSVSGNDPTGAFDGSVTNVSIRKVYPAIQTKGSVVIADTDTVPASFTNLTHFPEGEAGMYIFKNTNGGPFIDLQTLIGAVDFGLNASGAFFINSWDTAGNSTGVSYFLQYGGIFQSNSFPAGGLYTPDGGPTISLGIINSLSDATLNTPLISAVKATANVGINTISPDASSIMDVTSTDKGFLTPRMTTTQINAISSPAEGLEVYDTTLHVKKIYNGSAWKTVTMT